MRDENDRDYDSNDAYGTISQGRDDERFRRNREPARPGDHMRQSPYGDPRRREGARQDYPYGERTSNSGQYGLAEREQRDQQGRNYGWYSSRDDQYATSDQRGYGRYGSGYGQQSSGGSVDYSRAQYGGAGQPWQGGYGEANQRGNSDDRGGWNRAYDRRPVEGENWSSTRPASELRRDGGFTGKGPKGYVRSDERVREDVCDRLSDDDEVDASDITVTVENGVVTLEGTVETRQAKHRAEDIADSVSGVRDVHNRLRTRRGLLQEMGDRLTGRDEAQQHGHAGSGTRNAPNG